MELDERDRAWAASIAETAKIPLKDALARVARIVADADLYEVVKDQAAKLGGSTLITNAERAKPENGEGVNVVISVMPVRHKALHHPVAVKTLDDMARNDMRAQVARNEVAKVYGKPHSALAELVLRGVV